MTYMWKCRRTCRYVASQMRESKNDGIIPPHPSTPHPSHPVISQLFSLSNAKKWQHSRASQMPGTKNISSDLHLFPGAGLPFQPWAAEILQKGDRRHISSDIHFSFAKGKLKPCILVAWPVYISTTTQERREIAEVQSRREERQRQTDRQTDRQREREREREQKYFSMCGQKPAGKKASWPEAGSKLRPSG